MYYILFRILYRVFISFTILLYFVSTLTTDYLRMNVKPKSYRTRWMCVIDLQRGVNAMHRRKRTLKRACVEDIKWFFREKYKET